MEFDTTMPSDLIELQATERDSTLNPRQLRDAGFVPGTLYGKDTPATSIQVRAHEFEMAYRTGAREFKLVGPGMNVVARAQQVQVTAVGHKLLNIEFWVPSATGGEKKSASKKAAKAETPKEEAVLAGA